MKNKKKIPSPDLEEIMPLLIAAWRRFHQESGPADQLQTREFRSVVSAVQELKQGLETGKTLLGKDYFAERNLLGAYLLYQWVIHYQQGLSILGELPETPRRVLDVCSGPAAFGFAALRHGAGEVIATDRNLTALELGASVSGRYGLPITIRHWDCLEANNPIEGSFDLIILGHCLEELFPDTKKNWPEQQYKFIEKLLQKLTPKGFLLIVDDSLAHSNNRILQVRNHFANQGVPIQAPCVWRGECPALQTKNSPCYAQREFEKPYLIKEIQRGAQINLSSLKMSYVIFKSPQSAWPELTQNPVYRIISPPVETFQGKRYYLCGTTGKKTLESHLNKHPKESRAFDYLRRGELISLKDPLEDRNALAIIEGTAISVEAPCGKPIPEISKIPSWEQ